MTKKVRTKPPKILSTDVLPAEVRGKPPNALWTDVVPAVAAILALLLSLISLYQSYLSQKVAQESNSIAKTAQADYVTQVARQLKANTQNWIFVARSPDLRASEDKDWYQTSDLKPLMISTVYQQNALKNYSFDLNKGYIFIVIANYGPGDVDKIQFRNFEWIPKKDSNSPVGVQVNGDWGPLNKGYFYAILVDVLEPPDGHKVWNRANFDLTRTNYSTIYVEAIYQDGVNSENPLQIVLGDSTMFLPITTPTRLFHFPTNKPPTPIATRLKP